MNENDLKSLAILTRSRDDADKMDELFHSGHASGRSYVEWGYEFTKPFLKVVHYLVQGNIFKAFDAYEGLLQALKGYTSKSDMRNDLIGNSFQGMVKDYRKIIFQDLSNISETLSENEIKISSCATLVDTENEMITTEVWESIIEDCIKFQSVKSDQDKTLSNIFSSGEEKGAFRHPDYPSVLITISTIHGVKGETYDGVFIYTKEQTGSCTCDPPKRKWSVNLTHNIVECENKRLAYVAVSRAAQLLCIAAPSSSVSAWNALTHS